MGFFCKFVSVSQLNLILPVQPLLASSILQSAKAVDPSKAIIVAGISFSLFIICSPYMVNILWFLLKPCDNNKPRDEKSCYAKINKVSEFLIDAIHKP